MGTEFKILIDHDCENKSSIAAKAAFDEARRLNLIFSDYDTESELSKLSNSSYSSQKIKLSEELFEVLEFSKSLAVETEGAFDPTLGQLSRLWRISRFRKSLPSVISIKKAMDRVGSQFLILSNQQKEATILKPGIILDLGGIAKGYTADRMMLILKNMGLERCLIDAGGDLTLGKRPRQRKGWKIQIGGIKHPDLPMMTLENCSVATSGDSSQFVEINDRKYSHIVNPRTGYGLENLTQVTVIAPNGISADSLATTLSVLGPEKSKELGILKEKEGIRAFFVTQKNDEQILDILQ
jgi:thiamine biosynthesis lipoprotein